MTLFHVQHKSVPKWTGRGHFVYWKCTSSPGSHPTEKCSCRRDLWAGFVLWEAFFILFCLFLFTMCHVKNKSCPGTSQNSNIICNIISIQMRYLNQSQSLLTMCHLVRTLKRVLLNNCPFLILFFFFPITLTRQWHVSTYNTNLCSAQMNWARTFCLLEVHLVPQALILLKITAAAGIYWLDLCSERRFSFCFVCFPFTMCHVKNKSCPVASQNSNIICDIVTKVGHYLLYAILCAP